MSFEIIKDANDIIFELPVPHMNFSLLVRAMDYSETCAIWEVFQRNQSLQVPGEQANSAVLFAMLHRIYVGYKSGSQMNENLDFAAVLEKIKNRLNSAEQTKLACDLIDLSLLVLRRKNKEGVSNG